MESYFKGFNDQSKVWVYQSNRALSNDECQQIEQTASDFVAQWAAHGTQLKAGAAVFYNRFLVLIVDESGQNATGCSIDASVHFIKELGQQLNINWFDRMQVAYLIDEKVSTFDFREVGALIEQKAINENTVIFNNLVQTKTEWQTNWKQALNKSWLAKQIV